jgi:hypothetical protein
MRLCVTAKISLKSAAHLRLGLATFLVRPTSSPPKPPCCGDTECPSPDAGERSRVNTPPRVAAQTRAPKALVCERVCHLNHGGVAACGVQSLETGRRRNRAVNMAGAQLPAPLLPTGSARPPRTVVTAVPDMTTRGAPAAVSSRTHTAPPRGEHWGGWIVGCWGLNRTHAAGSLRSAPFAKAYCPASPPTWKAAISVFPSRSAKNGASTQCAEPAGAAGGMRWALTSLDGCPLRLFCCPSATAAQLHAQQQLERFRG